MCTDIITNNKKPQMLRLINNIDPTHTLSTRRRFVADMDQRFRDLKDVVREHIEEGALFKDSHADFILLRANKTAQEWRSSYDPDKIPEFMDWLEEQNNQFILSKGGKGIEVFPSQTTPIFPGQASFELGKDSKARVLGGVEGRWSDVHIRSAYQKGVQQARANLRRQGVDVPAFETLPDGLAGVFNTPFHVDRVQLAFTQTYSGMQGITKAMEAPVARVMAQGMADGRNPRELARDIAGIKGAYKSTINKRRGIIDKKSWNNARTLARTEVIRAHHGASIAEFRAIGVEEVIIKAEWLTAGDNRVCPRCESLEGQIFTLDEVEPLIPLHPNCRCVAIPIVKKTKRKVSKKVEKVKPVEKVSADTLPKWKRSTSLKEMGQRLKDNFKIDNVKFKNKESRSKKLSTLNAIGKHMTDVVLKNPTMVKGIKRAQSIKQLNIYEDALKLSSGIYGEGTNSLVGGMYEPTTRTLNIHSFLMNRTPSRVFTKGSYNVSEDVFGSLRHEWGHHLQLGVKPLKGFRKEATERFRFKEDWNDIWKKRLRRQQPRVDRKFQLDLTQQLRLYDDVTKEVSSYAAANRGEFFAESFDAYTNLGYGKGDLLPEDVEVFMRKYF